MTIQAVRGGEWGPKTWLVPYFADKSVYAKVISTPEAVVAVALAAGIITDVAVWDGWVGLKPLSGSAVHDVLVDMANVRRRLPAINTLWHPPILKPDEDASWFVKRFPYSTHAKLALRRLRPEDLLAAGYDFAIPMEGVWSYTTAMCVWVAWIVFPSQWRDSMVHNDWLSQGEAAFLWMSKELNNILKQRMLARERWWFEMHSAFGAHTLETDPEFDPWVSAVELATAKPIDVLAGKISLTEVRRSLPYAKEAKPVRDGDFSTFVRGGEWMTAGSAQHGKYQVDLRVGSASDEVNFKIKKNQIPDHESSDEILREARTCVEDVYQVALKEEVTKIRDTFSESLPPYLLLAYHASLVDKKSLEPRGSLAFLSTSERCDLAIELRYLVRLGKKFLAHDFKAEEAQLSTLFQQQLYVDEVLRVLSVLHTHPVAPFVQASSKASIAELMSIRTQVLALMDNRTIIMPVTLNGRVVHFNRVHMDNGLPSGTPATDRNGTWFNISAHLGTNIIMQKLGLNTPSDYWNRHKGDDSLQASDDASWLLAHDHVMTGLAFRSSSGKYGLSTQGDILRTGYDYHGAFGFPFRRVVKCVERNAWSASDPGESTLLEALDKTLVNLDRCCGTTAGQRILVAAVERISAKLRLPVDFVRTPREMNGLGIAAVYTGKRYVPGPEAPRLANSAAWRETLVLDKAARLGGEIDARLAAQQAAADAVALDQVPKLRSLVANERTDVWRATSHRWRRTKVLPIVANPHVPAATNALGMGTYDRVTESLHTVTSFASRSDLIPVLEDYRWLKRFALRPLPSLKHVLRAGALGLKSFAPCHVPPQAHIGEYLDWITGQAPVLTGLCDPAIRDLVGMSAATMFTPAFRNRLSLSSIAFYSQLAWPLWHKTPLHRVAFET